MEPSRSLRGKLADYRTSVWNTFDVMMYTLTIAGIALKNFRSTFMASRIMFAFNCAFFYVRVFRIYHANRNLGPKLVIFHRMVREKKQFKMRKYTFVCRSLRS